jgi:IS5 family transposase
MGLNVVTTKRAETIAVSIDCAVVVADLMNYLRMFDRPIALDAKKDSRHYRINYQVMKDANDLTC